MANNQKEKVTAGIWMKRVAKSLGYTGIGTAREIMPGLSETISSSRETIDAAKELMDRMKEKKGIHKLDVLANADGITDKYLGMARELGRNALEDFRSGNLNNYKRADDALNKAMGFDDFGDDFDFNLEDDFGNDFDFDDDDDKDVVVPNVTINSNINKNNPMVQAMENNTSAMVDIEGERARRDTELASAQMALTADVGSGLSSNLNTINSNIGQLLDFNHDVMRSFTESATSYYKTSIEIMGSMLVEIKKLTSPPQNENRRNNPRASSDIFGYDGSFNIPEYIENIKKNAKSYINNSMVGSLAGMIGLGGDDAGPSFIDQIIANPIGTALSFALQPPKVVEDIAKKVDSAFGAFTSALIGKFNGLTPKDDDNGFVRALKEIAQNIFGFKIDKKQTLNLGNYEKGAVPFDGITRKSIVEVIPGYLSKILSAITKEDAIIYDYEDGKYKNVNKERDDFYKSSRRNILYEFEDLDVIRDEIKNKYSSEEQDKILEKFENAMIKLAYYDGTFDYRDPDMMKKIFNNTVDKKNKNIQDSTLEYEDLEWIQNVFKNKLTETQQMKMFSGSNKFAAGEAYGNMLRSIEDNNPMLRTILGSGLYDDLKYNPNGPNNGSNNSGNSQPTERIDKLKQWLRAHRTATEIPRDYRDIVPDDEINKILADNAENKRKSQEMRQKIDDHSLFGKFVNYISNNRATGFLGKIQDFFMGDPDNPDKPSIVDRMITSMHKIIFGKEKEEEEGNRKGIFERIRDFFMGDPNNPDKFSLKGLLLKFYGGIKTALFGEKGFFTQIKESELYKNLTDKARATKDKVRDYLFGTDSTTGLFAGVKNTLSSYWTSTKEYLNGTEDDRSTGLFSRAKAKAGSMVDSARIALGGDPNTRSESPIKSAVDYGASAIKSGFQNFADLLFGSKKDKNGNDNESRINIDNITQHVKDNAPEALAHGALGLGAGAIISSTSTGLLGSLVLGPIGTAIAAIAGTLLFKSDKFNNFLFGRDDPETGQRIEGFISDKTQEFFKNNKDSLIAGGGIGALGGIGLGGLFPSFILGGPIPGAIFGMATALTLRSESFQNLMFGPKDESGNRTGGFNKTLANIFTNNDKFTSEDKKRILGTIGVSSLAGVGLLGLIGIGPIASAFIGAGAGIIASSNKFRDKIFGTQDANGNRSGDGLMNIYLKKFEAGVVHPMMILGKELSITTQNWFAKEVKEPIINTAAYISEGVKGMFKMLETRFEDTWFGKLITKTVGGIATFIKNSIKVTSKALFGLGKRLIKGAYTAVLKGISVPLRAVGAATRGVMGGFIDKDTRDRLKAEHKSRVAANKADAKERQRELEEFKNKLNSTDMLTRLLDQSNPSNKKEMRKAKKIAEKAMVSKYGKDFKKLSSVEQARIYREEAQAQDINKIRDILLGIARSMGVGVNETSEATKTMQSEMKDEAYSNALSINDKNTQSAIKDAANKHITKGGDADVLRGKNVFEQANILNNVNTGIDMNNQLRNKYGSNIYDDMSKHMGAFISGGNKPDLTPQLVNRNNPLLQNNNNQSSKNTNNPLLQNNNPLIRNNDSDENQGDENPLQGDNGNSPVDETSSPDGGGSGEKSALTKIFGKLGGTVGTVIKGLGSLVKPFIGKGALITIGILALFRLLTDPASFFKSVIDVTKNVFKTLFTPIYNGLQSLGATVQSDDAGYAAYTDVAVKTIKNNPNMLQDEKAVKSLFNKALENQQLEEAATKRGIGGRILAGDIFNVDNDKYSVTKRNKENYELAVQLQRAVDSGYQPTDDEQAFLDKYLNMDKSDRTVTFGSRFWHDTKDIVQSNPLRMLNHSITGFNKSSQHFKAKDDMKKLLESENKSKAIGESNVDENSPYYLHRGEGVLTASANHLFGGSETTAGILNAYARNSTGKKDASALTSIMSGTVNMPSSTEMDALTNAAFGVDGKYVDLTSYAEQVRRQSETVSDSQYWTFNEADAEKYGPMARVLFKTIRFVNYPSRLINTTLGDVSEDIDSTVKDIDDSKSKSTVGGKIKNGIKSAFTKIKNFFTGGNGGYEDEVGPTATTSAISLGNKGHEYYKFPSSSSIKVSDVNPNRTTSFGTSSHNGLDLLVRNRNDLSVKSFTGGTVMFAGQSNPDINKSYGNMVQVQDENGMYHLYGHLNSINVKAGDVIKPGAVLGIEGTTGKSSGNHVHYEVGSGIVVGKKLNNKVHPAEYMDGYNSGLSTIKATPVEDYVVGSYWDGTSGSKAQSIQSSVSSNTYASSDDNLKQRLASGEDILSVMYSPFIEFNNSLKSMIGGNSNKSGGVSSGTYSSATPSGQAIPGNSYAEQTWNYLTQRAGFTKNGAAGIMGNMEAESGIRPNNLENGYETSSRTDETYTQGVDDGSITRSSFSNDRYGYGLVQWTAEGRKAKLYDAIKGKNKSISDIGAQLEHMVAEMKTSYPNLIALATNPNATLQQVSDEMLLDYERPANKYSKTTYRANLGKKYLDAYGGDEPSDSVSTGRKFTTSNIRNNISMNRNDPNTAKMVSMISQAIQYLAQIAGNTKQTNVQLNNISENATIINKTDNSGSKSKPGSVTNNPMIDIANNRRTPSDNGRAYKVARSIAQGY
jgi:murein DD-endopeptidase MepM/ murein hydrolase activator NlpD